MKAVAVWTLAGALLVCGAAPAQTTADAARIAELEQQLALYKRLVGDWAGLSRYGSDNSELPPPAAGEQRVVFFGDQIVESWSADGRRFFPGKPYLNRGIAGQTTAQMLVRFRQDVIALAPAVVVIAGGSNDLTRLLGPGTEFTVGDNLMSMTELAKAHGIRVVLASVTPVCDCVKEQTAIRPQGRIIGLNGWIRDYAAKSGAVYLNYYAALAEGRDFKRALTSDGLMPNDAGYEVMARLAQDAITTALAK